MSDEVELGSRRGRPPRQEDVAPYEIVSVTVELPPQAGDIRIDGRVFQHNGKYNVTAAQAESLNDIMYRAWSHYREVRGEKLPVEAMRKPSGMR